MSRTPSINPTFSLVYTIIAFSLAAIVFCLETAGTGVSAQSAERAASRPAAPGATIAANSASLGPIPDSDVASPTCQNNSTTFRDVTFDASGISGPVTFVSVTFSARHTWVQDLEVRLIAPGGSPSHLLFSATGTTSTTPNDCGNGNDLSSANTYTFSDTASANWWTTAATNPVPTSTNRTVVSGIGGTSNPPAVTSLNTTFALTPINGTWTLRFRDRGSGDTGAVTAASLDFLVEPPLQTVVDFDGDGRTDASVVRNTGGGASGQVTWYNQPAGGGPHTITPWGIASDFFTPGDFDGDGKTDIAVWRQGTPGNAYFYILQSAAGTLRSEQFGQASDDPSVIGDYDGDGKDDIAVYRGDGNWYWRTTPGGPAFGAPWGQFGDFPAPGDYDGDGKNDFAVQRNNGNGQAAFHIYNTATSTSTITVFGRPFDAVVPGDYDGDGKTDIATARVVGGQILWFTLLSSGGPYTITQWGLSATDIPAQGDYDGDGKTDIAIWRRDANPVDTNFWIRRSSNGMVSAIHWGQDGDYPVANYNSH
jgi:subtilisin-like proprotein convertase family protein